MRIAISGSHRTGKSTLVEDLAEALPNYEAIDEPYHSMEEDGYEFSHPPALEDFVAQLERSLGDLRASGENVLFDRCPIDLLSYILVHDDADSFDLDEWRPRVQEAIQKLDLVVFVPIEQPDRIALSATADETATRELADEKLRELLVDDPFDFELRVLKVEGDLETRSRTVLQRVRALRP